MAEIINLRQARKRKARGERLRAGEQNNLIHGRTRAEKALSTAEAEKSARLLDAHRREPRETGDE